MADDDQSDLKAKGEVRVQSFGIRVIRADGEVEDWGREEYEYDEDGNVVETRGAIAPPTLRIRIRNELLKLRNKAQEAIR